MADHEVKASGSNDAFDPHTCTMINITCITTNTDRHMERSLQLGVQLEHEASGIFALGASLCQLLSVLAGIP